MSERLFHAAPTAAAALPIAPCPDGFVHLSTAAQLPESLRLHLSDAGPLVLYELDPARLGDALRWEPSRGGALFPHLYRSIQEQDVLRRWDDVEPTSPPQLDTARMGEPPGDAPN